MICTGLARVLRGLVARCGLAILPAMRIIATICVICLAAYLYTLGFGGEPDAPYTLGTALAQLLFVMFAFAAIVLLARSMEKDAFWPWRWWIKGPGRSNRAPGPRHGVGLPAYMGPERRGGRDRRQGTGAGPPGAERRRDDADRRRNRDLGRSGQAAHY